MKRYSFLILIIFLLQTFCLMANNRSQMSEQMKKMEPFIGKWKTQSFYTGKQEEIPGEIEYRRVLGNNWLQIEFIGRHPQRDYWEAYVMITFEPKKNSYIAYSFFNADEPTIMNGMWISANTFRLGKPNEKGKMNNGIDYTIKKDGTIFQENWTLDKNGQRQIRLHTTYTRIR